MNRIYKVIWSRVKNCYVVVSEIANDRGKINGSGGTGVRTLLCALALVGSVALPLNVAQAVNPAGTGAGVAWGNGADSGANQDNVALGGYAQALGTVALSLGAHSESTGAYSTAVGGGSHATAQNAAAIGPWSKASAENAVAVGANAESSGEYAAAIGGGAKAKDKHAIAVGSLSEATGEASLAVGNNSKASNNYAYAIGGSSKATGQWSIAMGTNATAQEDASVAIGTWSEATKGQATGIGYQAKARAIGATSLGRLSLVNAVDGTAIGSSTSVTGLNGTAIGNKANVSVKNGVAIGNEANVANENAVAIGAGSETAAAVGTASEMINGEVHNFAGANPGSTVSVGKAGAERTITNVAAGRLSATSTDAVNGSQLYAVNTEVNKGVVYAGDVKAAGANDNKFTQRLGAQTNVVGGVADVSKLSDNNIGVVSNGSNTLNVKLAKELQGLTSVTTGNTVMNTDGVTITGGPKIVKDGIDAGNKQITNVASGGDVITNGANIGDINRIVTAKDKYVTGGTATYQANGDGTANLTGTNGLTANVTGLKNNFVTSGSVSNDGKTLTLERNDTGKVNVDLSNVFTEVAKGDYRLVANPEPNSQGKYKADSDGNMVLTVANDKGDKKQVTLTDIASKAQQDTNTTNITNINNTIAKGLNFAGDTGADINKQLGEKLSIKGGADANKLSDDNIGVVSANGALNVKLSKELKNLTSVTTGNTVMNTDGLTITGGPKIVKDGIDAGGKKITNVAAGTDNTDAVNFGQLKDVVAAGKTILKDGKNTTVEGDGSANNPYKVNVNDDLVLGKKGADGKDGSIGVNGKDGSAVVINGKDGSIGLNGKDGANDISIKGGDGKPGVDGTNITRLVIEEKNGEKHDVATLDDGMMYGGDTGAVIKKKLNGQVNVVGGITDVNKLTTDDNIGVVSDGANNLKARLAKDLKGLNSVTTGDTVMNSDGLTITGGPKIVKDGIDAGGKKITNVAAGTENTDAVNFGQLKDAIAAGKTILKDGKNTTVEGDGSANNPYKVNVNDDLVLGKKGADGKDGSIGVNGKDGSAVVINGKDGSIGLNGKDGANGISIKGGDGKPGVDGTNITRLVIEEKNGDKHDVATLDDGMKYGGDTGAVIKKKLNEQVNVVGGITDVNKLTTDDNIGVVSDGANNLKVRLAKDLKGLNSVTTGDTVMNSDGLTINGGPKIVKDGIDAGGKKITNVAEGTNGTDAVNVNQLSKAVAGATTKLENGKNTTVTSTTNNDGSKTYKVNLNDDITLGTDPDKQISIKGSEGTIQAGKVTINGTGGTVNNLTNKTWDPDNITSGQAATEDQLKLVSNEVGKHSSVSEGSNISVTKGTNANGGVDYKVSVIDTPTFKSVTTGNTVMNNSGLTIKNGPSITETGIDAGSKKITNVAAGTADTDAVNVSQLKQIGGNIKNIDSRVNRVGAGAAALAALHPLDFDPDDKLDIAAGYGNYKDAHAVSIGAFYRPNEDTLFSVGGSFGGGENMLNAGVSLKLGQGNHVSTSRVAMAKELKDLRAELENMKGALMKVSEGKQLNSLDLDKMQLFPDVPENHWAYDYVATLAGNGIIVGYPDGKFGGDRMMTRYEMAALIYRAIQNGAVADEQMARALKEFQPELERIRVDTISKHKDGTPDIQRVRVIKGRG